jgi:Na+-translocating ferredoxin:NAD+ oxidoreductase RnfD subunit
VSSVARLRRFLRTPKGLLIVILLVLTVVAAAHDGWRVIAPGVVSAVLAAAILDALILRWRRGRWEFPDGAILSAMLVAMVLSAQQPWQYAAVTAVVAILSKYLVRSRAANVFNPAAFALVATFYVFDTGQSWWGALPTVPVFASLLLVLPSGIFIADRVNRMPLVLTFLGVYYGLFTATAFFGSPNAVAEVFRTPDAEAAIFFAVFILTDPPTSPVKYTEQIIQGVIVALVSFAVFELIGAAYYLLAGVLVGNLWEAWRRVTRRTGATFPAGTAGFLREVSPWRPETLTRTRP